VVDSGTTSPASGQSAGGVLALLVDPRKSALVASRFRVARHRYRLVVGRLERSLSPRIYPVGI